MTDEVKTDRRHVEEAEAWYEEVVEGYDGVGAVESLADLLARFEAHGFEMGRLPLAAANADREAMQSYINSRLPVDLKPATAEPITASTFVCRIGRLESALRELVAAQDAIDDARPVWTEKQMRRLVEAHRRAKETLR